MSGVLLLLFWTESSTGGGWRDSAVAFLTAVLFALGVITARRAERAAWTKEPTRTAYLLAFFGASAALFGAIRVDAGLLHRGDLTTNRLVRDSIVTMSVVLVSLWSLRKQRAATR